MVDVDARLAEDAAAIRRALESAFGDWEAGLAALDRLLAVLKEQADRIERLQREATADAVARGGVGLIAAERRRQVEAEGWSPEHDDSHRQEQIAHAAACYAIPPRMRGWLGPMVMNTLWPWKAKWWKPTATKGKAFAYDHEGDRVKELVKAGALIAAEIDRLQRAASTTSELGSLPDSESSASEASRLLTEQDAERRASSWAATAREQRERAMRAERALVARDAELTRLEAEIDAMDDRRADEWERAEAAERLAHDRGEALKAIRDLPSEHDLLTNAVARALHEIAARTLAGVVPPEQATGTV